MMKSLKISFFLALVFIFSGSMYAQVDAIVINQNSSCSISYQLNYYTCPGGPANPVVRTGVVGPNSSVTVSPPTAGDRVNEFIISYVGGTGTVNVPTSFCGGGSSTSSTNIVDCSSNTQSVAHDDNYTTSTQAFVAN